MSLLPQAPGAAAIPLLHRARRNAGRVLWIEQAWPAMLPALGVLLGLVVLSLLTLPQRLPGWLHALLLLAVAAWLARSLHHRLRRLRSPSLSMRDGRIERASRLPHRPVSTLSDHPVSAGGPGNEAGLIWQAHLRRTEAGLRRLQAGPPRLRLRAHDRYRLAPLLLLALAASLFLAGRDAPIRIASGFWPGLAVPLGPKPLLQAWITPPDYAGGAPIFLTDPNGRYTVPAGARLSASLTGTATEPALTLRGPEPARFHALSERSWSLDRLLTVDTPVEIRAAGYRLADWHITVQPIPIPVVRWNGMPGPAADLPWHTKLPWSVAHRYGVQTLTAELRLADHGESGRVLRVPIPLPGLPTAAHGVATPDLSADPWAGDAVTAVLVATDATGRSGRSAEARFTLPSRTFRNPLARAVLDLRRRLALGREAPAEVADDLQALGDTPGAFAQDTSLFLNLSTDASLLRLPDRAADRAGAARDEASDRLWQLALALEDGLHNDRVGARAALEVRAAQERLSAQIEHMRQLGQKGQSAAEQSELQQRIAALKQAIARRMQALAAQAARNHAPMPPMPDPSALGGDELGRMMKRMQDDAASGHAEEAMRELSQMQAMLEHMRVATPEDLQAAQQQAQAQQQARDQMAAVRDLVQRQSALLDHAQGRQAQQDRARAQDGLDAQPGADDGEDAAAGGSPTGGTDGAAMDPATRRLMQQLGVPMGDAPAPDTGPGQAPGQQGPGQQRPEQQGLGQQADAARQIDRHAQHVLRRALDELATEFRALTGKKADSLAKAATAMAQAHAALAKGEDGGAAQAQVQALSALQQGAQQMRSAMTSGRKAGTGLALLPGGEDGAGNEPGDQDSDGQEEQGDRDPLGRHLASGHAGMDDGDETHLPDQAAPARSREIEQELRRRDSDRTRPPSELDYLDRLLKPF